MNVVIRGATRALTPEERSLIALETLESATELDDRDGHLDGEIAPHPVPIRERFQAPGGRAAHCRLLREQGSGRE